MNAFLFDVYPLLRSRSFVSTSWSTLGATSMTIASCPMLYQRADRNSNVDQKLTTSTSERFNQIEGGDWHRRISKLIFLDDCDASSTYEQAYFHSQVYLDFAILFFAEFLPSGFAFCIFRNKVNDAILFTAFTVVTQYLQEPSYEARQLARTKTAHPQGIG